MSDFLCKQASISGKEKKEIMRIEKRKTKDERGKTKP
jgi:hypothetical protein